MLLAKTGGKPAEAAETPGRRPGGSSRSGAKAAKWREMAAKLGAKTAKWREVIDTCYNEYLEILGRAGRGANRPHIVPGQLRRPQKTKNILVDPLVRQRDFGWNPQPLLTTVKGLGLRV